jgi:4-hydroxybenzoate polyprenyltransferase
LFGVFAASITGAYFLLVYFFGNRKSIFVQKEFSVALIYTFGIWGGPASLMSYNFNLGQIILIIAFFICVFIAVIIFSYYEENTDRIDNHTTLVSRFGMLTVKRFLYFLFLLFFVLCISQIIYTHQIIYTQAAKLLMLMGILLLMILSYPETLKQNNRYRYLTEFVFWLPGLAFWF